MHGGTEGLGVLEIDPLGHPVFCFRLNDDSVAIGHEVLSALVHRQLVPSAPAAALRDEYEAGSARI